MHPAIPVNGLDVASTHLVVLSVTADLEDGYYCDVEDQEDAGVNVHRPVVFAVEDELVRRGGAVRWRDDVLKSKESVKK